MQSFAHYKIYMLEILLIIEITIKTEFAGFEFNLAVVVVSDTRNLFEQSEPLTLDPKPLSYMNLFSRSMRSRNVKIASLDLKDQIKASSELTLA